jgi:hypothetical protein
MVDAMAPFAGAGIIDMAKLAAYVLQQGFGVKNPDEFLAQQAPPAMGPEMGGAGAPPMPPEALPVPAEQGVGPLTGDPAMLQAMLAQQGQMPPMA